jgi:tetratricopeptide (TPR) repeat protein
MGDCWERRGNLRKAVESYEQAVDLNPHSPLDRIKLSHLRNTINQQLDEAPQSRRRRAVWAGALTCVLVAAFGSSIALLNNRPVEKSDNANSQLGVGVVEKSAKPENTTAMQQSPQQPGTGKELGHTVPVLPDTANNEPEKETITAKNSNPSQREPAARPKRNEFSTGFSGSGQVAPLRVEPEGAIGKPTARPEKSTPAVSNPAGDPDPEPENGTKSTQPEQTKKGSGIIEIKPSKGNGGGSKSTNGGSDTTSAGSSNWSKLARDYFASGEYDQAAKAYEHVLSNGGGARTLQRLAQCYEKLGRRSEAADAYRRASSAYERMIANGDDSAKAAKSACDSALRVLGG